MLLIRKHNRLIKGGLCAALLLLLTAARPSAPTTILIVRHAEKQLNAGDDPHLSEAGVARAQALARVVEHANIDVVYVSQFLRNKETVAPLAAKQISVVTLPVGKSEEYPKLIVNDILTKHSGKTVLIVSHSNIVPGIVEELAKVKVPDIPDSEYSRLYIVTVQPGKAPKVIAAQYGCP
ncbi:MAG TPA: phosphoglycerate mutase family protein [Thermoanaerobaculia bacterium]|nr:phosphoglycerate mutase family protein [Thermoanaerobaculia bacterium]